MVAGLAVFERETYFLAQSLAQLQLRYFPKYEGQIEFHASALRAPSNRVPEPFNQLTVEERRALIKDIYQVIADSNTRVFAIAMEKSSLRGDPYERGFEEIVNRFDRMLARQLRDRGEAQRGLIVVAESSYKENIELLAQRIATQGHRWGETHNLADIPYFAPSKSTRLLQLADFVSNAVFGRYESGYTREFDQIVAKFDQDQGKLHGLVHMASERQDCFCPSCLVKRTLIRQDEYDPAQGQLDL